MREPAGGTLEEHSAKKAAVAVAVILLHGPVLLALLAPRHNPPAPVAQHEIQLRLIPLRRAKPTLDVHKANTVPKKRKRPGVEDMIRALANHAADSTAPLAIGRALGCGASNFSALTPQQRAQCGNAPWHYDPNSARGFTLNGPKPEHKWSQAEINLYVMRTADPCLADKAAHLPFCVDTIIHGPVTIPDPAKEMPSGLTIGPFHIGN